MKVISGGNQMSLIRDTEEVLKFLEFAGRKSILNEHAINCRLTACNNLFAELQEEEDNLDYILKNLDLLTNRFRNRSGNVRASTLKVYKSRVKSSLEDFKAWSADPFAWERAVTEKAKANGKEKESRQEKKVRERPLVPTRAAKHRVVRPEGPKIFPEGTLDLEAPRRVSFPIRKGFNVEMTLPEEGITLKELQRLGMFLFPYCTDIDANQIQWPGPCTST